MLLMSFRLKNSSLRAKQQNKISSSFVIVVQDMGMLLKPNSIIGVGGGPFVLCILQCFSAV